MGGGMTKHHDHQEDDEDEEEEHEHDLQLSDQFPERRIFGQTPPILHTYPYK